ncbi:MAG: cytochrome P450 [Acidimicrobiia bacterium]|nr:cytochrome P450 [Acidimicrobiia bacterium]
MQPADLHWDPYDTVLDDDPHPTWKRMRDEAPVYRNDHFDFWALSRFADVEAASRDTATFSSSHGTVLELMGPHMVGSGQMIFMDPPEHTMYRQLVSRAFTPRRMAMLDDHVRDVSAELLDGLSGRATFDYVQDFAAQLPSRIISRLVGVPEDEREEQRINIDEMFHIDPERGMINDIAFLARVRVHEYLLDLVKRHQAAPSAFGDDMINVLIGSEITDDDGSTRRLTDEELVVFTLLLYVAGTETVMRLLGNAAVILAAHPDQRAELVADPSLIAGAVEELLRYEAPSPVQGRWVLRDTVVRGVSIPAGSRVLLLTGSAGRDEREYPDADRFDIRRDIRKHVTFGYGVHYCLGASLARTEGRIALEETLRRHPQWEVDPSRTVRQHTSTVRGWTEVGLSV